MSRSVPDAAELLELAVTAACAAGEFLVDSRPQELEVATKSTPTDVVTEMDLAAERRIVATLRASRPFDVVLGEEGQSREARPRDAEAGPDVRWIVDPIDGTVNYLYGLPQWAVSIAAEVDGVVEAGAVFDPSKGELFTAVRGGGARLDGRPMAVTECGVLSQALVGTGFGYDAGRRSAQARVLLELLPRVRDVRRLGAASLDLCAVACGRLDGYYERGLNLWDYAAAGLIASEAGARVGGLGGESASGEILVAANPLLFDDLADLLAKFGADQG
ncbi:MAG: inositol monophosphatase family protein [Acidothermaceae bacterium]